MKKLHLSLRTGLILAITLLLGGWLIHLGWHTVGLALNLRQARTLASEGVSGGAIRTASKLTAEANRHVQAVRRDLAPLLPFFSLVRPLPLIGGTLGQADLLVEYGGNLSEAADQMLTGLLPIWDASQTGANEGGLAAWMNGLAERRGTFVAASQAVQRAAQARHQIDFQAMPGSLGIQLQKLDSYFPLFQAGAQLLPVLPELAGLNGERTYLLAAQNEDELRASGGFISALGLLKMKDGRIVEMSVADSYSVDNPNVQYPAPPEALKRTMLAGVWLARDANFSPDFPTTARDLEKLYTLSTGTRLDGVIAFDQTAIADLLTAVGGVRVTSMDELVTGQNVRRWMREAWAPAPGRGVSDAWWKNRKQFMSELSKAIVDKLLTSRDPALMAASGEAGLKAVRSGHVLVWLHQPEAQQALAAGEIDGAVRLGEGDFLMLVDSNVGFNKVDGVMQRELDYLVDLRNPAAPQARLSVSYRHTLQQTVICKQEATYGSTYADLQARCYWDYWRVLAASGSRLASFKAAPVLAEQLLNQQGWDGQVGQQSGENGAWVLDGIMVLPAGGQQTNELAWHLPGSVLRQVGGGLVYVLRVQKQPGLAGLPLHLTILPPAGMRPAALGSDWMQQIDGSWTWQGTLEHNQAFQMKFNR